MSREAPIEEPTIDAAALDGEPSIEVRDERLINRPGSLWPRPRDPFEELLRLRRAGRSAVLATVVRTAGSTPRKNAARMIVTAGPAGDPVLVGTIGGGLVEKRVVDVALELLASGASASPRLVRYHLTHELAMCCGGEMEVFLEPMVPEPSLLVCGAGHVARALVPLARSVGFAPIVVDEPTEEGAEFATTERFPDATRLVDSYDVRDWRDVPLDAQTYAVIVTRDHAVDQRLLEALIGHDLAYLGLIGSRRKIAMFRQRLDAKGIDPGRFALVHAPIGLDIGAETPEEIAVAIVAELIQVRAARRKGTGSDARQQAEETPSKDTGAQTGKAATTGTRPGDR